jgi:hypothetical protein
VEAGKGQEQILDTRDNGIFGCTKLVGPKDTQDLENVQGTDHQKPTSLFKDS